MANGWQAGSLPYQGGQRPAGPFGCASLDYAPLGFAPLGYASLDYASLDYASLDYASLDYASLDYARDRRDRRDRRGRLRRARPTERLRGSGRGEARLRPFDMLRVNSKPPEATRATEATDLAGVGRRRDWREWWRSVAGRTSLAWFAELRGTTSKGSASSQLESYRCVWAGNGGLLFGLLGA